MQEDPSKKHRNEQNNPDSRGLSCYEGESDQILILNPKLIYFKNLVKIATEYWAVTYIKEKF